MIGRMGIITDVQLAWVAGLFEGEGCIGRQITTKRSRNYRYWYATVSSTDFDVLDQLMEWTGLGSIYVKKRHNPRYKPTRDWRVYRQPEVRAFLNAIRPLLCERRRARADEALADLNDRVFRGGRRQFNIGITAASRQPTLFEGLYQNSDALKTGVSV